MPQSKESARISSLRYYYENREKIRAKNKDRYWKDPDKSRAKRRAAYHANEKETSRWRKMKKEFGITQGEYLEMLREQDSKCAVCKTHDPHPPSGTGAGPKSFAIDHSHRTGFIRGLLCANCNLLLGNAKDNIEILKQAIKYVEERGT